MPKKRKPRAPALIPTEVLRHLAPLYRLDREDAPASALAAAPDPTRIIEAHRLLIDLLLPGRFSRADASTPARLAGFLGRRLRRALGLLRPEIERAIPYRWLGQAAHTEGSPKASNTAREARQVVEAFARSLPAIRGAVLGDIEAAYAGDPAALTFAEVQLSYPGLLAIAGHRVAHELYRLGVPIVPRVMSEWVHTRTGADIHPGAEIGRAFFIDHATGVVIGETTRIGDRVKIYQGVTLGARSFPLDANGNPIKHIKRHPTVEDDVVIYSHATILGGDTVLGRGATIGGNVFLMESVPPGSLVSSVHPDLKVKPARGHAPA